MPSRFRVPLGYVVGVLALSFSHPRTTSLAVGVPLALLGEALRIWASGHIEKTRALATGGPYAHTRNPLYVGSVLIAVGVAAASASPWTVMAVALYLLAFYPSVMREESRFLREKFGAAYDGWAQSVPLFVPRLTAGGPRDSRFSWDRVRINREWRTAVALPLLVALLFARGRWTP